eukprot:gnl/TRDRNA2_/TRDRNA2_206791_c0_seq1.p1 gnl/TRDRNA2_/TRDRNA2_206791_c0~~gnl/TRDRNA2_/TRDRNA2_206791_c0_seq1.p1  ORF type:complete len:179 (+),score=12.87 gnl/TRDRNA2_/TRDRNA2_206791_c0_seq1:201-737(+)
MLSTLMLLETTLLNGQMIAAWNIASKAMLRVVDLHVRVKVKLLRSCRVAMWDPTREVTTPNLSMHHTLVNTQATLRFRYVATSGGVTRKIATTILRVLATKMSVEITLLCGLVDAAAEIAREAATTIDGVLSTRPMSYEVSMSQGHVRAAFDGAWIVAASMPRMLHALVCLQGTLLRS